MKINLILVRLLAIPLLFLFSFQASSQQCIRQQLYSAIMKDSLTFDVWLPEGWKKNQQYPAIYMYNYGAADGKMLAGILEYCKKQYILQLPEVIVVAIHAEMDQVGYQYESGSVTGKGDAMIGAVETDLIPLISRKFGASPFRVFLGYSYTASYASYVFQNHPGLFKAYILVATEQVNIRQPAFDPPGALQRYYQDHEGFFFIASGENDMTRRIDFASEIGKKLGAWTNSRLQVRHRQISGADHQTLLPQTIIPALEFLFAPYSAFQQEDSINDVMDHFSRAERRMQELYGLPLEKSVGNMMYFGSLSAFEKKDTAALVQIGKYFITPSTKGLDLRNFAYWCHYLSMKEQALAYYNRAIAKCRKDELHSNIGRQALMNCYRELAFDVYTSDKEKGWNLLKRGAREMGSKEPEIFLYLGKFSAERNCHTKEGLTYLLDYELKRKQLVGMNRYPMDEVYMAIARCYKKLDNQAAAANYIKKALEANPANKAALDGK